MLAPGVFVADRYEIINKIGAGGMSNVYKAKDHILGRDVAVKILKQEFSEDATFVAKFRSEAQSAAGLEHPNIVNIYDVGSENGVYFIVMEYVEGITLKTYIEKKGQLNFKEAISIAIQVGRGIEAAHSKGIIHRDIKPQNIIISTEGKVKVTDFGIARAASSNTIHADVMGSVHYSSPEQARNGFVDGKSDIYSLGIVMYEMVTGRVPFDGESTVAIAIQHLQENMVAPSAYAPDLPISLEKIILKATQKSPDRRYSTISDMLMDLKKALVSPYEDFVTIVDDSLEKTRVITREDQEQISNRAARALFEDISNNNNYSAPSNRDEEYYDDEDEYYDDEDEYYDDDEYYEDWEEGDNKSDKLITILGIAAGIIIVIIVVVILGKAFNLFNFGKKTGEVEMVNVIGDNYEQAIESLQEIGLDADNIKISYVESADYEADIVSDQSVKEDEKFNLDEDVVTLSVVSSDGGKPQEAASDTPKEEKKDDKKKEEESDKVVVPDVAGFTEADAKKALETAGLVVTSTSQEFSDNVPEGSVISQSLASAQEVAKNSNVTLVISKGAKKDGYDFEFKNPEDGPIQVSIPALGQTVTLNKGQVAKFHNTQSPVEVTYTFTPSTTNEAGEIVSGEPKTVSVSLDAKE